MQCGEVGRRDRSQGYLPLQADHYPAYGHRRRQDSDEQDREDGHPMIVVRAPRRAFRRAHRGQALVFLALATLILMGAMGLALDGGYNYAQPRQMQNVADAAALAGARALARNDGLPGSNSPVLDTVQAVAQQ